ncbi:MAG: glycosyltransferase, partial [Bacteroidota bacterium]
MLNILYFADPNTVHDIKWIEFFTKRELCKAYLICRPHQYKQYLETPGLIDQCKASNILVMKPVKYLSIKNWIATIKGVRYIDSVIRKNEIALIHVMYAEPNALWALFKFVFRIPMLLTTRGTDILYTIPN